MKAWRVASMEEDDRTAYCKELRSECGKEQLKKKIGMNKCLAKQTQPNTTVSDGNKRERLGENESTLNKEQKYNFLGC